MTLQTNESIHITQTVATPFSFQGSQDVYQLMVVGRIRGVNQADGSLGEIMALAAGLGGVGVYFGVLFLRPLCYPAIPRHGGAAGGE